MARGGVDVARYGVVAVADGGGAGGLEHEDVRAGWRRRAVFYAPGDDEDGTLG